MSTTNISIEKNLDKIFLRLDGKKAGPFEKTQSGNFFDTKNHELYYNNGVFIQQNSLIEIKPENPEDLISIYINDENLCQCITCKISRDLLLKGINTDLINKIESVRDLIFKNYDDKIPENPNWLTVSVVEQINILNMLLTKLSEYEGLDNLKDFNMTKEKLFKLTNPFNDFVSNPLFQEAQIPNKKIKISDESIAYWLIFQLKAFTEKNILFDISTFKLANLKQHVFNKFMTKIEKNYNKHTYYEEGLNIKIKF